jgi:hypothetical protein
MMNRKNILVGLGAFALAISSAAGQPVTFTAGNLVVLQAGEDGNPTALTSAATKLFLKEINASTGAIVQTIPVPFTATTSGNRSVTQSGSATSEGALTLSADGKSLVFVGYNADAGTTGVVGTTAAAVNRVVAVVDCDGVIDSTTAFADGYSANNIRSAVSSNGTDIWTGGTASNPGGGVRYITRGGSTTVFLNDNGAGGANPPTNIRFVNIFSGQLYFSSSSTPFLGVGTVGTGLPTTTGQTFALLPGLPTAAGPSNYDFYFADSNTLYMTDDRTLVNGGGIQKWTQSAGTWTLAYTLNSGLTGGLRHVTGVTTAGVTTLYTTSGATSANSLLSVVDTGAASAFATITSTGANTWWRGVDFVPTGCATVPCYADCDGVGGLTANDFACFLTAYINGDSYANCDGVGGLTANDFVCFLTQYNNGCP